MEEVVAESGSSMGVALNFMLPMDCSMGTPCEEGDEKLTFARWQRPLVEAAPTLYVMQDMDGVGMVDAVGCGHDDLVVYDSKGRVFEYLPSRMTFNSLVAAGQNKTATFLEQDMKTPEGYANVIGALEAAKGAGQEGRCHVAPHDDAEAGVPRHGDPDDLDAGILAAVIIGLVIFFVCAYRVAVSMARRREINKMYNFTKVMDEDDDDDLGIDEIELGGLGLGGDDEDGDDDIGDVFKPEVFNALRRQFEEDGVGDEEDEDDDLDFGDIKKEDDV